VSTALLRWLRAPGSLSRRLAMLGDRFEVQALSQRVGRLLSTEKRDLHAGGRHLVREVMLRVDGVPLVWARTVVAARALRGPWRALRGLGTRPLADVLFRDPRVKRSALQPEFHRRGSRLCHRADAAWHAAAGAPWPSGVVHGRSSTFVRRGAALRVFEAFAPAIPPPTALRAGPPEGERSLGSGPAAAIASMRDRSRRRRTPRSRPSGSAERP